MNNNTQQQKETNITKLNNKISDDYIFQPKQLLFQKYQCIYLKKYHSINRLNSNVQIIYNHNSKVQNNNKPTQRTVGSNLFKQAKTIHKSLENTKQIN